MCADVRTRFPHRRLFQWVLLVLLGLALAVAGAAALLMLRAVPEPDHLSRRGVLQDVLQTAAYRLGDSRVTEHRLSSDSGLEVNIALRIPGNPLPQRPLVLLMTGQETGREAVALIEDTRGVLVAAISYPFATVPHRETLGMALALSQIQRGILDTPAAVLLTLDYLYAGNSIAPGRVELAGVSFGAYLAAAPAALDERISRVWLIHGSADPAAVFEYGLRDRIEWGPLRRSLAWYLGVVAASHHLSSEHWLERLSPRPVVVVNARGDTNLPSAAVQALHRALLPPFEILWTEGGHVHPKQSQVVRQITELMFSRIAQESALP